MSGDPYIKENERLEAEIARLQESVNYLQIADNHHQELMAEKEDEIDRLRLNYKEMCDCAETWEAEAERLRTQREIEHGTWVNMVSGLRAALEQIETTAMGRPVYEIVYIARKALAKEGK